MESYLINRPDHSFELIRSELGEEGLQTVEFDKPDIVLLDYQLPDMSGLQFYKRLRLTGGHPCPVIILTGTGNYEVAAEAMRMGVDGYLVKSVAHSNMGEKIIDAIERFPKKAVMPLKIIHVGLLAESQAVIKSVSNLLDPYLSIDLTIAKSLVDLEILNTAAPLDLILTDYQPIFDDQRLLDLKTVCSNNVIVVISKIENETQVMRAFDLGISDILRYGSRRYQNLPDVIRALVAEQKLRLLRK